MVGLLLLHITTKISKIFMKTNRIQGRQGRNLTFSWHKSANQAESVVSLLLRATKVKQRRRGDKFRRREAGLLKSGGGKTRATHLRPLQAMGLTLRL